jgi:tetratricopeptide (TPR) repeat protein
VITPHLIEPSEFIAAVQPLLERKDATGLQALLRARWTHEQIKAILDSDDIDARKVACLALALVGGKCAIPCLSRQLQHPDPVVNQMAEHALWSIWLHGGTDEANRELCRGMRAMNQKDMEGAVGRFTRAIELDPNFAEAYNQRAIAKFLAERYEESILDCREAVRKMDCHFGAWAGMGHCHAQQGRMAEAVECYEKAISINPHLDGIREALVEMTGQAEC